MRPLQTQNGYILRNLYNGERLQRYFRPSGTQDLLWFASSSLQQKDAAERRKQEKQKNKASGSSGSYVATPHPTKKSVTLQQFSDY
jgi:hypothetical protein